MHVSLVLDVGDVQNSWMSSLVRLEKREEDKPPPAFTTFYSIRSILYNFTCAAPAVLLLHKFPAQISPQSQAEAKELKPRLSPSPEPTGLGSNSLWAVTTGFYVRETMQLEMVCLHGSRDGVYCCRDP